MTDDATPTSATDGEREPTGKRLLEILADFLSARLDDDESYMRWTTDRGTWEHVRNYAQDDRGQIRHKPTGDYLGSMHHPADAEHAVRWQPRRVSADITAKRGILNGARAYRPTQPGDDAGEKALVAVLRHLAKPYSEHVDYPEPPPAPQSAAPRRTPQWREHPASIVDYNGEIYYADFFPEGY